MNGMVKIDMMMLYTRHMLNTASFHPYVASVTPALHDSVIIRQISAPITKEKLEIAVALFRSSAANHMFDMSATPFKRMATDA